MTTLRQEDLAALPADIKALVQDGVYALYSIRSPSAKYLLVTNRQERYFLSSSGAVVPKPSREVADSDIIDVVVFAGPASGDPTRINLR